jgi:hypothetical protein
MEVHVVLGAREADIGQMAGHIAGWEIKLKFLDEKSTIRFIII